MNQAGVAQMFCETLDSKHGAVIMNCLSILKNRFVSDDQVEGYLKDGSVAVARFELGESNEAAQRDARILRQRQVSSLIENLLVRINSKTAWF